MSFLIDTDVCSAYLKNTSAVFSRFVQYSGRLHVSIITVGELTAWTLRSRASPLRGQALVDMLANMTVLPVNELVAARFGKLRAETLDQGLQLPPLDLFIAAPADVHGLSVVTHNVQDFAPVPGLSVVDWLVP